MSAAIGLGCRAGASIEAILRLVGEARARAGGESLHTGAGVGNEALAEAASRLGLPLHRHEAAALARVAARVLTHSPRVTALHGVGSLAEAAALVGAGEGAVIVLPKFSADGVSCAVARAPT